ncbi:LmbE family N-acetylglucosaminyl deacetylase [Halopolyspora algeriensis]|uniref:LmbE family N-acetylglucosaminyl deacetylase n=1 Tax=Halopolyspora algeriensis TaxID=1500506 RepID=A0A368VWU8_9ACTN|nr:PIG-L deacetylase family protein [Halopolyspora algeriensis]RCW46676.1 LmbE family N-acetylglucosaminyl deacetylase [Halopolyspora algeriensis]TQM46701.1 LmbE family N-acetylglucosaminyl deacetylase [Halopolyspora algeriensis]
MTTAPDLASADFRRALVVTAHPDDVDFGCAGTVATWTAAGVEVTYCVCTSGEAGAFDGTSRADVPELRQQEQRAAAEAAGVAEVVFLGYRDGQMTVNLALRRDIAKVIRTVCPDVVVTHSPEINWDAVTISHPDHRAVGEATLAAIYPDARNASAHPDLLEQHGLQPWTVSQLWMSESSQERINRAVDITEQFDTKMAALRAHHSQTARLHDLEGLIRQHLEGNAERYGPAPDRLAEVFHVVDTA